MMMNLRCVALHTDRRDSKQFSGRQQEAPRIRIMIRIKVQFEKINDMIHIAPIDNLR
jgi:hypothetical protein